MGVVSLQGVPVAFNRRGGQRACGPKCAPRRPPILAKCCSPPTRPRACHGGGRMELQFGPFGMVASGMANPFFADLACGPAGFEMRGGRMIQVDMVEVWFWSCPGCGAKGWRGRTPAHLSFRSFASRHDIGIRKPAVNVRTGVHALGASTCKPLR
jgi:hypothetical protein